MCINHIGNHEESTAPTETERQCFAYSRVRLAYLGVDEIFFCVEMKPPRIRGGSSPNPQQRIPNGNEASKGIALTAQRAFECEGIGEPGVVADTSA